MYVTDCTIAATIGLYAGSTTQQVLEVIELALEVAATLEQRTQALRSVVVGGHLPTCTLCSRTNPPSTEQTPAEESRLLLETTNLVRICSSSA